MFFFWLHFIFHINRIMRSSVRELNRKKDVVCLILSYPPFNSRNYETHIGWIRDVLEINHKARESLDKKIIEVDVSELCSEINRLLHHSTHDLEAFIPQEIIEKMRHRSWFPGDTTPRNAMLDLCVDDFMIRQILQSIQIPEIRMVWISKANGKTFLCRLMKLPPVRQMFDIVIHINVEFLAVKDIEDRIIEELGFSKSSRGEADEFLRIQNFLILLDHFNRWRSLYPRGNGWWNSDKTQKMAFINNEFDRDTHGDLAIWREDHFLSWNLFCRNVSEVVHSSSIQPLAVDVLRQCSGHLLAIVLIGRALKDVKDVFIWHHASRVIGFRPTTSNSTEDRILLNALAFVMGQLGSAANKCLKYCASNLEMKGTHKVDLLERWMKEDLIQTLDDGEQILQHLVSALLLESFGNGELARIPDEIHKELLNFYKGEMNPILLVELDGRGLLEAVKSEAWEEANEMYLMNNKISKLPDNPNCPLLSALFLQGNLHLRVISPSFFQFMPILQILNLSQTRIKSLPKPLFK